MKLMNACARVITRTGRSSHITPVLKELHYLLVHLRTQYKVLTHIYRAIHHQSPGYLNNLLSVYRPTRSLRSESTILLTVPRTRTVTLETELLRKQRRLYGTCCLLTTEIVTTASNFKGNKIHFYSGSNA